MNIPEFGVVEFSRSIKRVIEDAFGYVRIRGEVVGFKQHSSGHLYFSLKEDEAIISAVCFKNMANLIDFSLENGLEVVASGKVTTYNGRSNYQIVIEKLEIAGIGAILKMIEKRRQKLQQEGLFEVIHKKSLPFFPKRIAVITSKTGAVIEDIKHRISERFPTNLILYPATVQGSKTVEEVVAGVKYFNNLSQDERPDLIIIARGGGSFEDLLPFNDENLVRAVFASKIPIISAIGHETDNSLIDYVADLRAPTPTAAAEIATPILADLKLDLSKLAKNLNFYIKSNLSEKSLKVDKLKSLLLNPSQYLLQINQKIDFYLDKITNLIINKLSYEQKNIASLKISKFQFEINLISAIANCNSLAKNLKIAYQQKIDYKSQNLSSIIKLLQNSDYKNILKRGFALIKNKQKIISSISEIKGGDNIELELSDGKLPARIIDKKAPELF